MPKILSTKIGDYKNLLPDRAMEMQLTDEELKIFLEAFPKFASMQNPIDPGWEPATIKVVMTIEAFKKKPDGR